MTHQTVTSDFPTGLVYLVKIGKAIQIGFTTNLEKRLKSFRTATTEPMQVLATFPGGKDLEKRLHELLAHVRIANEFSMTNIGSVCFSFRREIPPLWLP